LSILLKELQKLCDLVQLVSDEIALRQELQVDNLKTLFSDLHLVALASLGQGYTGEQL